VYTKAEQNNSIPVIKAVATKQEGVTELIEAINTHSLIGVNSKKSFLLAEKAYRIIQNYRMKGVSKINLQAQLETETKKDDFNLYRFVKKN